MHRLPLTLYRQQENQKEINQYPECAKKAQSFFAEMNCEKRQSKTDIEIWFIYHFLLKLKMGHCTLAVTRSIDVSKKDTPSALRENELLALSWVQRYQILIFRISFF